MDSAETTLQLDRVIELGGKHAARQQLDAAEVDQQRITADVACINIEVAVDQPPRDKHFEGYGFAPQEIASNRVSIDICCRMQ